MNRQQAIDTLKKHALIEGEAKYHDAKAEHHDNPALCKTLDAMWQSLKDDLALPTWVPPDQEFVIAAIMEAGNHG